MHCLLFAAADSLTGIMTRAKGARAYFAKVFQLVSSHISGAVVRPVYNRQHNWTDYKIYCKYQEHTVEYGWLLRYCTVDFCKAVQNWFG